ncbi:MAG: nuclear transport factor 2 family protein [Ignavibacterium sp.]
MDKRPDFAEALRRFLGSISSRDLDAYRSAITKNHVLYTIIQSGHAFSTRDELLAMHEEWFKDKQWTWNGSVVHTVVGEDMALALIRYEYRSGEQDEPFSTWLTYVFRLEDNEWRLIHDHNTAVDFHAFARSARLDR